MGKITILDDHIANQIAAGEVVERPASVVKELIENSIDANSTMIEIRIKEGGLTQIKIKDDGDGIEGDDIEKAFFRHATSKIRTGKDLFRINSLGFRGEALPSIAAVSRITLKTSTSYSGNGREIRLEAGNIKSNEVIAFPKGTEIVVEDIFFNTPARLKYLRSIQTEIGHIIDYVNRLSLAYPNIAFTLIHNDRLILNTNGDGNVLHVLAAIYGTGIAKNMLFFEEEDLDFKVSGYISKPEITRANKSHISVYVNGRYIKNFLVAQSIVKGYKTLLMVNRFPIAALNIEMDPSLIDVNVHPAKLEVRFSKEQEILKLIEQGIYNALNKQSLIREPIKKALNYTKTETLQPAFDLTLNPGKQIETSASANFLLKEKNDNIEYENNHPSASLDAKPFVKNNEAGNSTDPKKTELIRNILEEEYKTEVELQKEQVPQENIITDTAKLPLLDPIGQLQGTYIICQSDKGLYLIDQHAAHERVQYERNIKLIKAETKVVQELLIPITIDYPKSEIEQINSTLEILANIGVEIEQFGSHTYIIRTIPQWIPKGQEEEFIDKMIQMAIKEGKISSEELRKDLIASTSCKSSIKANQYLTKQEIETLIEQLRHTENPFSCPHGRPVIIHFSFYDIEKMFKRVV